MSDYIHTGATQELTELKHFLNELCEGGTNPFLRRLSACSSIWTSVAGALPQEQLRPLERLASSVGVGSFFSAGNLKAHYVLDEDFVDGGSAFVLFALVGSTWTHVARVTGQAALVPKEAWICGPEE